MRSEFITRFEASLRRWRLGLKRKIPVVLPLLMPVLGAQPIWSQTAAKNPEASHLEALLDQAQEALHSKHWQEAVPLLKHILVLDPRRWESDQALGNAYLNLGQYQDAIDTYEKGIAVYQAELARSTSKARLQDAMAQMLVAEGNAYLKLRKPQSALVLYRKAAEIDPNPGLAYFNLAATLYNQGQMEEAILCCDKAIAADPGRADTYFIKGSALYGNGTIDAKNRFIVPPGTVEVLKKYLELAPEGGHAADVKAMLDALGIQVEPMINNKK